MNIPRINVFYFCCALNIRFFKCSFCLRFCGFVCCFLLLFSLYICTDIHIRKYIAIKQLTKTLIIIINPHTTILHLHNIIHVMLYMLLFIEKFIYSFSIHVQVMCFPLFCFVFLCFCFYISKSTIYIKAQESFLFFCTNE